MKVSSATAVALLSGLALAAPKNRAEDDSCGAASTVTITQSVTAAGAAGAAVTVTVQGSNAPAASPVTVTYTPPGNAAASPVYVTVTAGGSASASAGASAGSGAQANFAGQADAAANAQAAASASSSSSSSSSSGSSDGSDDDDDDSSSDSSASASANASAGAAANVNNKAADYVTQYLAPSSGVQISQACPTGGNGNCLQAQYNADTNELIKVEYVTLTITTVNGVASTSTITVTTNAPPTVTPAPAVVAFAAVGASAGASAGQDVSTIFVTTTETDNGKVVIMTKTTHTTVWGTGTAVSSRPTHLVSVGQNGAMAFNPNTVQAAPNDIVRFRFYPSQHSVTSCKVDNPCVADGVFDSGIHSNYIQNSTDFIDMTIGANPSPQYFFSKQTGECKQGFVFAINPSSMNDFNGFMAKARAFTGASNSTNTTTTSAAPTPSSTAPVLQNKIALADNRTNTTNTTADVHHKRSAGPFPVKLTGRDGQVARIARRWGFNA